MIPFSALTSRLSPARGVSGVFTDKDDWRSAFEADVHRITFSEHLRLLADKTQVHGPSGSCYTRSRLTHSLEVSQVARSLGQWFVRLFNDWNPQQGKDVLDVLGAAALMHDMGNPPFGHSGEDIMGEFFRTGRGQELTKSMSETERLQFENFEGNAQAFRLATRLEGWRSGGGLGLTAATLAAFAKYPFTLTEGKRKYGLFLSDFEQFERIAHLTGMHRLENGWRRHPLAYLSEAADDICYLVVDLEDAVHLGLVDINDAFEFLRPLLSASDWRVAKNIEQKDRRMIFLRSRAITSLVKKVAERAGEVVQDLLDGTHPGDLILQTDSSECINALRVFSRENIYNNTNRLEMNRNAVECLYRTMELSLDRIEESKTSRDLSPVEQAHILCDFVVRQTDHSIMKN